MDGYAEGFRHGLVVGLVILVFLLSYFLGKAVYREIAERRSRKRDIAKLDKADNVIRRFEGEAWRDRR